MRILCCVFAMLVPYCGAELCSSLLIGASLLRCAAIGSVICIATVAASLWILSVVAPLNTAILDSHTEDTR